MKRNKNKKKQKKIVHKWKKKTSLPKINETNMIKERLSLNMKSVEKENQMNRININ